MSELKLDSEKLEEEIEMKYKKFEKQEEKFKYEILQFLVITPEEI